MMAGQNEPAVFRRKNQTLADGAAHIAKAG
jgi:hypothetical protein